MISILKVLILAIGVQAQEDDEEIIVPLIPKLKSFYRDFETHHKHPLVGGTKVYTTNYLDLQYYGTLLYGQQQQALTAIFDPGSTLCWMPTIECITA